MARCEDRDIGGDDQVRDFGLAISSDLARRVGIAADDDMSLGAQACGRLFQQRGLACIAADDDARHPARTLPDPDSVAQGGYAIEPDLDYVAGLEPVRAVDTRL